MSKITKFPSALISGDYTASSLMLNGGSIIDRWIREKRLSKAYEMLRLSSLSVADVAYSLGFENPTHFSRIFKQQYGYAPSQS
jgi:transcriptional regulator GlxA family with amidase domain